jgi:hypothetical protein
VIFERVATFLEISRWKQELDRERHAMRHLASDKLLAIWAAMTSDEREAVLRVLDGKAP